MWGNPRGKRELNSSIEIKDIARNIHVYQVIKGNECYKSIHNLPNKHTSLNYIKKGK